MTDVPVVFGSGFKVSGNNVDAQYNRGNQSTLEGVSIDLLHGALANYIPQNGMSVAF